MISARVADLARAWVAADPDPVTRDEIRSLLDAASEPDARGALAVRELEARFAGHLTFGTAGLRAEMGGGPMRMNRLVVRRTAAGLARFVGPGASIVIGFDARHRSSTFALDSARVLAAAGCTVHLFDRPVPTPVLAFAIGELGTDAGVMCTASHNPRRDNGYKVYLGDGAQIIPPIDQQIAATIATVDELGDVPLSAADDPAIDRIGARLIEAYIRHASAARPPGGPMPTIVYTPLHGVGRAVAHEVLVRSGFTDIHDVAAQADPDPDFPTVAFPNPEEVGVLDLAIAEARRLAADVVLANDPDADRLGVALPVAADRSDPTGTGWRVLSGNEIGAVLAEHILRTTSGADRLVVSTFVSSRLLARQAEHHGVHHAEVLTGFKWVVRPGMEHRDRRFVFGYEEALGFAVDARIHDKDGITAARAFADLLSTLAGAGGSVDGLLEELARRHGHHATRSWSVRFEGHDAGPRMAAVLDRWRTRPVSVLGGLGVVATTDLAAGGRLPPTDALVIDLERDARVVLRPSGTEPKVKVYVEVVTAVADGPHGYHRAQDAAERTIDGLTRSVATALGLPEP